MAEDSGQERTEDPTPRRKQQAREKGQVAHSRELNTMLMMLSAGIALLVLGPALVTTLSNLFRQNLHMSRANIFDPGAMIRLFESSMLDALWGLTPFFIVVMVAAVAGPLIMGGINFNTKAIGFKWEKLDPVKGLQRLFAWRGLVELLKTLAKFMMIATIAVTFLYHQLDQYLTLAHEPIKMALAHTMHLLLRGFLIIASSLILLAAVDVPFQLWDHNRQLKMTFQEIRDENKENEGNPEVRGRVRRLQKEMAQRRMMTEVPNADVVVTNPEHYAVALKYDPETMPAPVLLAKGADLMAIQIRNIAREHNVMILEAPPLARALHHTTEIDAEIPAGLYLAVAQVLAYVFQLKRAGKSRGRTQGYGPGKPHRMNNLPIPDDMQFDS
ncbi:MAG TPA: flagellar biosynthesis protein FlhB [Gammaproteobacteria bacterium]|nr:flagellar biosynthesis protein FlhB [Gammaproteobacteria bacterium]